MITVISVGTVYILSLYVGTLQVLAVIKISLYRYFQMFLILGMYEGKLNLGAIHTSKLIDILLICKFPRQSILEKTLERLLIL